MILKKFKGLEKLDYSARNNGDIETRRGVNGHTITLSVNSSGPDSGSSLMHCHTCGRTIEYARWCAHQYVADVEDSLVYSHLG